MLIRTWLILLLVLVNFLLAYGIAIFYNQGKSPAIMIVSGVITVILMAILGVPNKEPEPSASPEEPSPL